MPARLRAVAMKPPGQTSLGFHGANSCGPGRVLRTCQYCGATTASQAALSGFRAEPSAAGFSAWRAGGWNEVRMSIVGDPPTITTWVNGVQILQHVEPASVHPARGHIGLQIHGGARSKGTVRYRNVRARPI